MNNYVDCIKKKHWMLICMAALLMIYGVMSLSSCAQKYDKEWILGKTSSEIEERYGPFDYCGNTEYRSDGNYYNGGCAYRTKEERVGYFGTDPAEYYRVYFDSEGKAYEIKEKWFVPGG